MAKRYLSNKRVLSGAVLAAVGLFMLVDALSFGRYISGGIGADFFPKIVSACLLACGLAIAVTGVREVRKAPPPAAKDPDAPKNAWLMWALTIVVLIVYIALLDWLGFILATAPFCFSLIIILTPKGKIKLWQAALVAVLVTVGAYLLFVQVFQVMLPQGLLG